MHTELNTEYIRIDNIIEEDSIGWENLFIVLGEINKITKLNNRQMGGNKKVCEIVMITWVL